MQEGVLLADGRAVGSEGASVSACAVRIHCCHAGSVFGDRASVARCPQASGACLPRVCHCLLN